MIADTVIPTSDELAPLLAEATSDRTEEEFITGYLAGLLSVLEKDPRQYRGYGPYWWPLKALLTARGINIRGDALELGTLQHYTLASPALTLCAAWAYQQERFAEGKIRTASHQLDLPDGDTYAYELIDDGMEELIQSKLG
ncbi:peptide-binding protein [Cronobacter sakazakii]|uniref:peptide-binding protein n=1 Tax=Cronobacter sakazakii TaxID=28141 RepID=UPI000CF15950|nr:peptide-binding protein [Cronobacter sakazakii]PPY04496.1 peptide-binding protein [Cronobacter sakazakii]